MPCSNMFNNDQQGPHATMGPRISFSNDFAETQQPIKRENTCRDAPVSSDFEFSVSGYNMISADELFSKGKLIPLRENCTKLTLRDELLIEDDYMDASPRVTKGTSRWRERLGLKKSHISPRKGDKNVEVLERIDETTTVLSINEVGYAADTRGAY